MARIRGLTEEIDLTTFDNLEWNTWSLNTAIYSGSGTITNQTTTFAYWTRIGELIIGQFEEKLTISGTAANTILRFDLPVVPSYGFDGNMAIGTGIHVIASTNYFSTRSNVIGGDSFAIMFPSNFGSDVYTTASLRWHRQTFRYRAD